MITLVWVSTDGTISWIVVDELMTDVTITVEVVMPPSPTVNN
jgi:hypothetical protein